jgi:protein-tyrosine phosphatase
LIDPAARIVDIHVHLIPGVDDGPADIESTLELLRVAHQNGVRTLVATPHMFLEPFDLWDPSQVRESFTRMEVVLKELSERPENEFLRDLSLHLGAENYACQPFLKALDQGAILTLADSRYVLIEFSPMITEGQILQVVDRVRAWNLVPVLAHVERYEALHKRKQQLASLIEKGCLTQVNLSSLLHPMWSKRGRLTRRLIKQDLVSLIASDSHGRRFRPPVFEEFLRRYGEALGTDRLHRLCSSNPAWIVQQGKAREQPGSLDFEQQLTALDVLSVTDSTGSDGS